MKRPLLMVPGPVELSPAVLEAASAPPPGHLDPDFVARFGRVLRSMRRIWKASEESQPFVLAGSGTIAMEMALTNVLEAGDRVLVVNTGYFSDRMKAMVRAHGIEAMEVGSMPGDVPGISAVAATLKARRFDAVLATHVDTSTGVRIDPKPIAELASERDVLSIFDGVCATGAEQFEMHRWGADIYLTASQKALGAPPGLALMVASPSALAARDRLSQKPPLSLDFEKWQPIMEAYEEGDKAYFSTPATGLVCALETSLTEIDEFEFAGMRGVDARIAAHKRAAEAMQAAWEVLELGRGPVREELAAHTLSALFYPDGIDASLLETIRERGVAVAGGLYPGRESDYFRVGHMGHVVCEDDKLLKTIGAIAAALAEHGHRVEPGEAVAAAQKRLEHPTRDEPT